MAHEDAGKYSRKHPAGTSCDPAIVAAVKAKAENGRVACAVAHDMAADFRVAPSEIGKTMDLLEYRIVKCQLGLFGYSPEKKIVKASEDVSEELRNLLRQSAADGKISCASCWKSAQTLVISKMAVSEACELLGIKISPCQLGAF
jgi:hypothetical protein